MALVWCATDCHDQGPCVRAGRLHGSLRSADAEPSIQSAGTRCTDEEAARRHTRAALSHPRDVVYRAPFRSSTNHARSSEDSSIVPSWRPSCYRVWVSPSSWCSARRNTKAWRRYRPCTHRITPWCSTWDSFDRMACSSHRDSFVREVPPCCCCRRCRTCGECTIDIISCLLSRYRTHRSPPGHSLSISKPQPTHTHTHTHPPSL